MPKNTLFQSFRLTQLVVATLALAFVGPQAVSGQDLATQLSELQAKVARLEAAISGKTGKSPATMPLQNDTANMQGRSNQATSDAASSQIPPGFQLNAGYQNCLQCHRTRPTGPLPPSHLERIGNDSAAGNASGPEGEPTTDSRVQPMGGSNTGMAGGGMGKGMMGGGMAKGSMGGGEMGMGKAKMGGGMGMGMMGCGMGMSGMSSGSGGMGGDSGKPGMGSMGNAGGTDAGMSGIRPMDQLQQMQQQMQMMMQMQMMQMKVMEMQMKMLQMKQ